jgi:hypothetical protein
MRSHHSPEVRIFMLLCLLAILVILLLSPEGAGGRVRKHTTIHLPIVANNSQGDLPGDGLKSTPTPEWEIHRRIP